MTERTVSNEWLMVNAGDPLNFYMGKPCWTEDDLGEVDAELVDRPDASPEALRLYIEACMRAGKAIHLTNTRLFFTHIMPQPDGTVGIVSQLTPISGCAAPTDLRIVARAVVFPADTPGMAERITDMVKAVADRELQARTRAAGLVVPGRRQ